MDHSTPGKICVRESLAPPRMRRPRLVGGRQTNKKGRYAERGVFSLAQGNGLSRRFANVPPEGYAPRWYGGRRSVVAYLAQLPNLKSYA